MADLGHDLRCMQPLGARARVLRSCMRTRLFLRGLCDLLGIGVGSGPPDVEATRQDRACINAYAVAQRIDGERPIFCQTIMPSECIRLLSLCAEIGGCTAGWIGACGCQEFSSRLGSMCLT